MSESQEAVEKQPGDELAPVIEGLRATYRRRLWVVIYAAPALAVATWLVTYSFAIAGVVFGITMGGAMLVASRMSKLENAPLVTAIEAEPERVERLAIESRPGGEGGIYSLYVSLEGKGRYMLYLPSRQKMEAALKVFHTRCPRAELSVAQPVEPQEPEPSSSGSDQDDDSIPAKRSR